MRLGRIRLPGIVPWGCAAGAALGVCGAALAQSRPAPSAGGPLVDGRHPILQPEELPIAGNTLIYGDPAQAGPYLLRRRLAPNETLRPRVEDRDRLVTVLQGTLWIGRGDVFRPDLLMPVREGGVAFLPAGTHYFGMAGNGVVVLQLTGAGPVKTAHTEVDASGKPVPEEGPYPVIAAGKRPNMPADPDLLDPDQLDQMEREAARRKAAQQK